MSKKYRDGRSELHDSVVDTEALNLPRRYRMLGIGIDHYQDTNFGPLDYAVREVKSFGELLTKHYGFAKPQYLFNDEAEQDAIQEALESFAPERANELGNDDALLIYFAGHGKVSANGSNSYFATYEADASKRKTWYAHSEFINELAAIQARYILLIANSCFSGGLVTKRSAPNGSALSLASISGQRSREIITSGKGDQQVYDNSSFATALQQTLRNPSKPWVLSDELHIQARAYVSANDGHLPRYGVIRNPDLHPHPDARFIFQRRGGDNAQPAADEDKPATKKSTSEPKQSSSQQRRYVSKNPDLQAIVDNDVFISGGSFLMGSPEDEEDRYSSEGPQHWVQVPDFYMARYPVTRGEYARFARAMGRGLDDKWRDPGFEQSDDHPVVNVSWSDTQTYIEWLKLGTGLAYRLPSESEWEYACRAGTNTRFWWGNDVKLARLCANYGGKYGGTTTVGSFKPNPWGLYDMTGNVWEWVQFDWESIREIIAPSVVLSQCYLRGGSWYFSPKDLCSANRARSTYGVRNHNFGIRLARSLT